MSIEDGYWLLPEGIEEILPPTAWRLESLRRDLLDLYDVWGYELVIPPFVEFLDALLVGTGNDLELHTFKLTDQVSGRLMGVRADMTPQVTRIDAHHMPRELPSRLCYIGTVLRTRSDGLGGSRSPLQVGAELYGHSGYESDLEVLCLMLETLALAGVRDVHLDLGHVAVFRGLVRQAGLTPRQEDTLFDALQRKAVPEIRSLLAGYRLADDEARRLLALAELNGGAEVLEQAECELADAPEEVLAALENLHQLAAAVEHHWPGLPINFDLAELRGYRYHTGVVFAAYVPGVGQAIAKGGRYDDIGRAFGYARPATGFSTDLRALLTAGATALEPRPRGAIYAPRADDPALEALVAELRQRRERVIRALPGLEVEPRALGCDRILQLGEEGWTVRPLVAPSAAAEVSE
ncbi:MAG TPA: ATP phosphoribosyltransferase regulatory subunit [Candidatus Competibacteraceae bacterium]|nr:ATP phosphoribosyltransferase regulatory subunit [Candidatus Competibacteraceae bacterium]